MEAMSLTKRNWLLGALAVFLLLAGLLGIAFWSQPGSLNFESVFGRTVLKERLVGQMRTSLFASAEAEKSAVLAETDNASLEYAGQARAQADRVAAALVEFKKLARGGEETGLVQQFEEAFAEYRKVDEEVLALAVLNTNLKSKALSHGQALAAVTHLEEALAPFLSDAKAAKGKPGKAGDTAALALRVLVETLRIQALHGPHIEEVSDAGMDEMEKRMNQADKQARSALAALASQAGQAALAPALAAYEEHHTVTLEVLRLSRLNTNVRSLALSLGRKVKVLAVCDESLQALENLIHANMAKATR